MKFPRRVRINGIDWKVEYVERIDLPDDRDGDANPSTLTIRINNGATDIGKVGILLHEMYHAANISEGDELVEQKAQQMLQFMFDNFDLLGIICELIAMQDEQREGGGV